MSGINSHRGTVTTAASKTPSSTNENRGIKSSIYRFLSITDPHDQRIPGPEELKMMIEARIQSANIAQKLLKLGRVQFLVKNLMWFHRLHETTINDLYKLWNANILDNRILIQLIPRWRETYQPRKELLVAQSCDHFRWEVDAILRPSFAYLAHERAPRRSVSAWQWGIPGTGRNR